MSTKRVRWNNTWVEAAAPHRLAEHVPELSVATVRRAEQAVSAVLRYGDRTAGSAEVAARLLLRAEGLASSAIEGIKASAASVALAEITEQQPGENHVASWVADNLVAISEAVCTKPPLTTNALLGWHASLMRQASTVEDHHVGAWRDVLGWIGGPNPRMAVHVASPAEDIPELMEDLMLFIGRDDLDAVTQAAIAHAQFETIHPFADGNGRIGRVLIGWILCSRLAIQYPPPISLQLARDVGGYQAGLTLYRQDQVEAWISWFAQAVVSASESSTEVLSMVSKAQEDWRWRTSDLRSDSAARRLCELLPSRPVLSALTAAKILGVSRQAAAVALSKLEELGVLVPLEEAAAGHNPKEHWWAAKSMLDLLGTR